MRERHRSGLIKTLLNKVVRIETEPREAALNRHLGRMNELTRQKLALSSPPYNVSAGARSSALHDIETELRQRGVGKLPRVRELVIFNSKRLALQ